jgi:hypothetical protein
VYQRGNRDSRRSNANHYQKELLVVAPDCLPALLRFGRYRDFPLGWIEKHAAGSPFCDHLAFAVIKKL